MGDTSDWGELIVTVDLLPPVIDLRPECARPGPADPSWCNTVTNVVIDVWDAASGVESFSYTQLGETRTVSGSRAEFQLGAGGRQDIKVTACDRVGRCASQTLQLKTDGAPPAIQFNPAASTALALAVSVADAESQVARSTFQVFDPQGQSVWYGETSGGVKGLLWDGTGLAPGVYYRWSWPGAVAVVAGGALIASQGDCWFGWKIITDPLTGWVRVVPCQDILPPIVPPQGATSTLVATATPRPTLTPTPQLVITATQQASATAPQTVTPNSATMTAQAQLTQTAQVTATEDRCKKYLEEIRSARQTVKRRYAEWIINALGLRDDGHRKAYTQAQNRLRNALAKWRNAGCGDLPDDLSDAEDWTTLPLP